MAKKQPKQSPDNELATFLQYHLDRRGMTAGALADKCGIARSTISRLLRGKGNRGNKYNASLETLEAMARALQLNVQETDDLFCAAYPQFRIWRIANQKNLTMDETDDLLEDNKLPTLSTAMPLKEKSR